MTWRPFLALVAFLALGCGSRNTHLPEFQNSWIVLSGSYGGAPMDIRLNEGLQSVVGHPSFPNQIGISATLAHPTQEGLALPAEDSLLRTLEEGIAARLEANRLSLFAAVVTTGGTREFIFYSSNENAVRKVFPEIQASVPTHQLKLTVLVDRHWGVYNQFRNAN